MKIIAVGSGGTLSEVLSTFGHVKEIKRSSEGYIFFSFFFFCFASSACLRKEYICFFLVARLFVGGYIVVEYCYAPMRRSARPLMRSTFHPLSLDDFGISSDQGFLPHDPRESVPDCQPLNDLGHQLPKLLSTRTVRPFIEKQRSLLPSIPRSWEEQDYRAAMRILSFASHAYVWESPDHPAASLPPQLAQPWYEVAQRLGRPPVLSYASYALDNWRRLDPTRPIELDNIVLLQNFLGGLDEEWFVVVHIQIERQAGAGLAGLLQAVNGAASDLEPEVLMGLRALASSQTAMRDTLLRMKNVAIRMCTIRACDLTSTGGRTVRRCRMVCRIPGCQPMPDPSNSEVKPAPKVPLCRLSTLVLASATARIP